MHIIVVSITSSLYASHHHCMHHIIVAKPCVCVSSWKYIYIYIGVSGCVKHAWMYVLCVLFVIYVLYMCYICVIYVLYMCYICVIYVLYHNTYMCCGAQDRRKSLKIATFMRMYMHKWGSVGAPRMHKSICYVCYVFYALCAHLCIGVCLNVVTNVCIIHALYMYTQMCINAYIYVCLNVVTNVCIYTCIYV